MTGILAVWNDCTSGAESDYERWYIGEHLPERLGVPGFRRGWRYEAVSADLRYFTYYEVDRPEVLASPAYMERLESPTPWTRRIMKSTFRNASRTVCELTATFGGMAGSHVISMRWGGHANAAAMAELAQSLHELDGATKVQVWNAAQAQTPKTEEAHARGRPDDMIGGALVIDCVRASDANGVCARLAAVEHQDGLGLERPPLVGTYAFLCMLERKAA